MDRTSQVVLAPAVSIVRIVRRCSKEPGREASPTCPIRSYAFVHSMSVRRVRRSRSVVDIATRAACLLFAVLALPGSTSQMRNDC